MRDIIWLLRNRGDGEELITRMREISSRMLTEIDHEFKVTGEHDAFTFPLSGRRNLLLYYKEALHNIVRHSDATFVVISLTIGRSSTLTVSDNGKGLKEDPNDPTTLVKLRGRAKQIPADLTVTTGKGTRLELEFK